MTEGCCNRFYDNMACDCNKRGILERVVFTLEDIKKFCLEYDKKNKDYPESKYEGRSLYAFIDQKLDAKTYSELKDYKSEAWEKEMEDVGS